MIKNTTITTKPNIQPQTHDHKYIAVQLPEVVSQILWYLAPYDSPDPKQSNSSSSSSSSNITVRRNTKHLCQCLFVNRLWYECALRHLWRHVVFENTESDTAAFHQFARAFSNKHITHAPASPSYSTSMHLPLPLSSMPDSILPCDATKKVPPAPSLSAPPLSTHHPPSLVVLPPTPPPTAKLHHKSLRSLTLRHIKGRAAATTSLTAIAKHATHLQRLDLYIGGDYVTNGALTPFFTHTPNYLTHVSLAGCHRITDASILTLARHAHDLAHLDLRACDLVSDVGIIAIATSCPHLYHLNVGRVHKKHRITDQSIVVLAQHQKKLAVLGLAGCDISDASMLAFATHRRPTLERVSVNQCHRLTNRTIQALLLSCPQITVFELKACPQINDWRAIEALVDRKVSLSLSHQQKLDFQHWSRRFGKNRTTTSPIKR